MLSNIFSLTTCTSSSIPCAGDGTMKYLIALAVLAVAAVVLVIIGVRKMRG